MTRRNSLNQIHDLADLSQLGKIVVNKRLGQRAQTKKSRRNRHYEKQFIHNILSWVPSTGPAETDVLLESIPNNFGD